jgi:Cell division protein SepF
MQELYGWMISVRTEHQGGRFEKATILIDRYEDDGLKILDFVQGFCFALGFSMRRIDNSTFECTPQN